MPLWIPQVRTQNGIQSTTFNITDMGPLILATTQDPASLHLNFTAPFTLQLQLNSLAYATRALLLGSVSTNWLNDTANSSVISASFFQVFTIPDQPQITEFAWGDVIGGIEATAHNITAALLGLHLGVQDDQCLMDQTVNVYQYNARNLWLPYGVSITSHDFYQ